MFLISHQVFLMNFVTEGALICEKTLKKIYSAKVNYRNHRVIANLARVLRLMYTECLRCVDSVSFLCQIRHRNESNLAS